MRGFPVKPEGSKRWSMYLAIRLSTGTPCCRAIDQAIATESIRPDTVEPCLLIFTKTSPGVPSS